MKLDDAFKDAKAYVRPEVFAVAQVTRPLAGAFATIVDDREITVVLDQGLLELDGVVKMERDWRLITLDVVLPFEVVGVTARIATALAVAGVSLLPLAAFSRDHFLVRERDLDRALKALRGLGIAIIEPV
jgi:hypothetical protein